MELLIVTHRFPYPTRTGDTLTVFHLLKHFSQRHTLDLVSCTNRDPNCEYLDAVAPFCRSVHTVTVSPLRSAFNGVGAVLRRKPLQSDWFYTSRVSRTIEQLMQYNRYDVLYAHTVRTARYITELNQQSPALRVLAMQISMQLNYRRLARYESNPLYRLVFNHEAFRLATFESELVEHFDRTLVISEVDRAAIRDEPSERFFECPHGVTLDDAPARADDRDPDTIVFSGNMNYRPNVDAALFFVREIFPHIRAQVPDVVFFIVGANPHRSIRALSKQTGVRVTGEVDSVYSWLRRAAIGINPLRAGAGLQNKVLEGMACGLPMVVTPVANEGIRAVPGIHLLAAETPSAFADEVVRLLHSADLRRRLGDAARKFIAENWSWDIHFDRLEHLFEHVTAARHATMQH